jgi:hypothetical protein
MTIDGGTALCGVELRKNGPKTGRMKGNMKFSKAMAVISL